MNAKPFHSHIIPAFAFFCALQTVVAGCGASDNPDVDQSDQDLTAKCPALTYPSGVEIQTYPDAALTAVYKNHLEAGQVAPTCFLDTDKLLNPKTGEKYSLSTKVATNFELEEFVGTEVPTYGHFALVTPAAVKSLQEFREKVDEPVSIISSYRSPLHQEATCREMCGDPLGCTVDGAVTCSRYSRHMWGDAVDLPLAFYTSQDEERACASGFKFAYKELGTHLHIDQNPAYKTCVLE